MLIEVSVSEIMLLVILMEGGDELGGPESCSATCGVEQRTSKPLACSHNQPAGAIHTTILLTQFEPYMHI